MKKTKIIATLGPATFTKNKIQQLIAAGVDVFRINMSHEITLSLLADVVEWIRKEAKIINKSIAIIFDLCGPKIRVGELQNQKLIKIVKGKQYSLGYNNCDIPLNIPLTFSKKFGSGLVKIDDGSLSFEIIDVTNKKLTICSESAGTISAGKGINFPGISLKLPAITEKDVKDVKLAIKFGVDWIAMSFVRKASDAVKIKNICKQNKINIPIIAKIEKPEAINNLQNIISAFDGILVARGDLGVETPISELPILQKRIVNECWPC